MRDISELNGEESEPLDEYHERIKVDIAAFMLKRMVGDVTSVKERAEFMNACVAASATMAAGQSVFLAGQAADQQRREAIIDTGRATSIRMLEEAFDKYVAEALVPLKK